MTKSDLPEQSPRSVADLLGMGEGVEDAFLDIGASVPVGSSQGWDNGNDWVIIFT